jgi:hypothetical protein
MDRRTLLKTTSAGFGYLAFAGLNAALHASESKNPLAPKPTHFKGTAKHVIFMFMPGAPSHVDTFDYKPQLQKDDGKTAPGRGGFGGRKLLASPWKFNQSGESGLWISEIFPELGKMADEMCLLRGMYTDSQAHPQATLQMHTGSFIQTRPSMGAWILYGMGTDNDCLPGFISIRPAGGAINYGSSFLPGVYQGTRVGGPGGFGGGGGGQMTIGNISNRRLNKEKQRDQLDFLNELNADAAKEQGGSDAIESVITSFELAFRMQGELPKVMDLKNETAATLKRYGIEGGGGGAGGGGMGGGGGGTADFGRQCLTARRLVEAGVRFVEISHGNWDQHNNLKAQHEQHAKSIDQPIAALIADLKDRGLLKDTLIVWGGEFGRTPSAQGTDGRDHNNRGFAMWMAGGGVKGGLSYGKTDDYGFEAVEGKTHVHDLHATILHLLGFDHEKLTYRHAGRDYRLTDVYGKVVKDIIA